MATRSAILYQGEDLLPALDYTDQVIWEESEFGTRAWRGEGSSSSVVIRDPFGEQGNASSLPAGLVGKSLAAKNLFVITLGSDYMFRGRVGIKNYSRDEQHVERYRQVDCNLHDTNWDLDHIFVHNYARPAETDIARVQGLIASYLAGSPRPSTVLNGSNFLAGSNTVALAAQTFMRTSPLQILRDISTSANKQFFVTGDSLTGGSLFWDGNDSTVYSAGIRISDRIDEIDTSGLCSSNSSGVYEYWTWEDTPLGTAWGDEYLTEPVVHPVSPGNFAPYASPSNGVQDSSYAGFGGALGSAQFHSVNHDSGQSVAWEPGWTGTWTFYVRPFNNPIYWSLYFTDVYGATVSGGTYLDVAGGTLTADAWNLITVTIPAAPAGTEGIRLAGRTAAAEGGVQATYWVDEVTIESSESFESTMPTFPPIWNVGPASTEDGSEQLCEVRLFYGAGGEQYVTAHNLVVHTQYGHASQTFTDDTIPTAGEATLRANAILAHRQYEDKTYNVTIGPLRDDQVLCVRHGQTINIKARAIPDADDQFRLMRIVQCRYTTPVVGTWFAHLQLGRPWKLEPYGTGTTLVPESASSSGTTPSPIGDTGSVGTDAGMYPNADHVHAHGNIIVGGPYHEAADVTFAPTGTISSTNVQAAIAEVASEAAAGYAPIGADYLVGTANATLTAEIVVGTTPGGELGGTWASPTVDATHSGSAHHAQDHATRHAQAGADAVKLDDLATPDDNTDLNTSTTRHGLLRKLSNVATEYLDGSGAWSTPAGGGVGPILIADTHSTPLIFADLIQNEAQDDLVYADTG